MAGLHFAYFFHFFRLLTGLGYNILLYKFRFVSHCLRFVQFEVGF